MKRILQFARGSGEVIGIEDSPLAQFSEASLATQRVSDPVVLTVMQGYSNEEMIRESLFGVVEVEKEAGKFPAFGREGLLRFNTNRALRGQTNKMEIKQGSVSFELDEHSLGFALDSREMEEFAGGPDRLKMVRQGMVNYALDVDAEIDAATTATTAGSYTAAVSGAGFLWATSGDPVKDIIAQREVIRTQIGTYPDTAVFDPTAWKLFRTNDAVRSYISKFTAPGPTAAIITEQLAAVVLEVKRVMVGKGVFAAGAAGVGDSPTMADIWSTVQAGNVVLAFTGLGIAVPTFGMQFRKRGYPRSTAFRWEIQHSDIYETQLIYQHKITLKQAGQLIYSIA